MNIKENFFRIARKRKDKRIVLILGISAGIPVLFLAGFLAAHFFLNRQASPDGVSPAAQTAENSEDCAIEERPLKIRGDSMSGLVENGEEMKILMGYYKCNSVSRGDLVVYDYPGEGGPLIKIAKAVEGDKFRLEETKGGCWNIFVNGSAAKNSRGEFYCIGEGGWRMLSLYEKDYGGVIPSDAVMILSNDFRGSLDSTRFGLVGKGDLLGKATRP